MQGKVKHATKGQCKMGTSYFEYFWKEPIWAGFLIGVVVFKGSMCFGFTALQVKYVYSCAWVACGSGPIVKKIVI